MQDAPTSGRKASQPDDYQGSQSDIGQLVGTSTFAWPPVSAVLANPNTNLITGSAGLSVSYVAPAAQQGALSRPVQPGQQPGHFYFPSMSADLRPASAPTH